MQRSCKRYETDIAGNENVKLSHLLVMRNKMLKSLQNFGIEIDITGNEETPFFYMNTNICVYLWLEMNKRQWEMICWI